MPAEIAWLSLLDLPCSSVKLYGGCLYRDYLAVVGECDTRGLVALISKDSGDVVGSWVGRRSTLTTCLAAGDLLAAAGVGQLYLFDEQLKVLKSLSPETSYRCAASDGQHIYLAGKKSSELVLVPQGRRLEVRELKGTIVYIERWTSRLEPVSRRKLYFPQFLGPWPEDLAVGTPTGTLWLLLSGSPASDNSRASSTSLLPSQVVVFDAERLDEVRRISHPDPIPLRLCFDPHGNAFVAGHRGVAKYDVSGRPLAQTARVSLIDPLFACVDDHLYLVEWLRSYLFVYILSPDLQQVERLELSKSMPPHAYFEDTSKPVYDGQNLYIAGNYGEGEDKGVVLSIRLHET